VAVNLVSVTTINRAKLYQGQPTTSFTTLYTVPGSTDVKVSAIVLCNTTAAAATATVSVVSSGGTAGVANEIVSALSISANSVVVIDTSVYMTVGDFIAGLQGTSSAITLTVSGETYA
jgi:hypothetical protein